MRRCAAGRSIAANPIRFCISAATQSASKPIAKRSRDGSRVAACIWWHIADTAPAPANPAKRRWLALFDETQRLHPGQGIAVIGRSLGSGIASQLAAQRPVAQLALITPFDSMVATAKAHYPVFPVGWLLDERYESDKALKTFEAPVLIVHAGLDEVVPEANTVRLIAALSKPPTTVRIANADHNDISAHPEFESALSEFLSH